VKSVTNFLQKVKFIQKWAVKSSAVESHPYGWLSAKAGKKRTLSFSTTLASSSSLASEPLVLALESGDGGAPQKIQ